MADIQLKLAQIDNTLNQMKNNTGTSRVDNYYASINDMETSQLESLAWDKKLLITITPVYGKIYKLNYQLLLT